jgi:hypothetical protein
MASITCENPREFEAVKKAVEAYIIEQERDLEIWQKVMEILKPFDGKAVSKRMETAVKKIFPDLTVYLENDYLIILHIWGGRIGSHDKRINIYLRKGKDAMNPSAYSHADTLANSGYFPFIPERNEKLRASLLNDARVIKELVGDFNNCVKRLQAVNEEAERYGYPLSSILDLKS